MRNTNPSANPSDLYFYSLIPLGILPPNTVSSKPFCSAMLKEHHRNIYARLHLKRCCLYYPPEPSNCPLVSKLVETSRKLVEHKSSKCRFARSRTGHSSTYSTQMNSHICHWLPSSRVAILWFMEMRSAVGRELGSIKRALTPIIWYFVCFWVTTWVGVCRCRRCSIILHGHLAWDWALTSPIFSIWRGR